MAMASGRPSTRGQQVGRRALGLAIGVSALVAGCEAEVEKPARAPAAVAVDKEAASRAIGRELDDLNDAAARADEPRYFAHYADDAVFLGTDAKERWDMAAFRAYAHPRFAAGKAWTFRSLRRAITVTGDGRSAYFDEDLDGAKLGAARGSGVVALVNGTWKIEQYNLALTIPNERFAEVRALVDAPPSAPFEERKRVAYEKATEDAGRGDFTGGDRRLAAMVPEAEALDGDAEFWLHNEKTWLRWAAGDLTGALDEIDRARSALTRARSLSAEASARTGLHEKWDRAYVLLELAVAAPPPLKAEANRAADAARTDYESAARPLGDHDGEAVLEAFFAVRRGNPRQALEAAKRVNVEADGDVQDLYVLALAYDAAKDAAQAEAIRRRIRAAKEYLMKPLIVHQMELDRAASPKTGK
jgi:ketosteroid isomerase-like protein